jgi:hypothetical protein
MSLHNPLITVGNTHASSVIAVVRCSDTESGTVTRELDPLNDSAFPYLPEVVQVVFAAVPLFPFPEASLIIAPMPSSKL